MANPSEFHFPLIKKEQLTKDTYSFYFKRGEGFDFKSGQYIKMTLTIDNPDSRGTSRLFTICSSPLESEYIQITTRIIQSSFKKKLVSLAPGEVVQFWGPMGSFTFDEAEKRPQVFLAGGIGVTPFHSMLNFASSKNYLGQITLFVSFSTSDDVLFHEELLNIQSTRPNIRCVFTVSQPENSTKPWEGETGRISQELMKKYITNITEPVYLIVGPPKMVEAMEALVSSMGVSNEQIKVENFVGY